MPFFIYLKEKFHPFVIPQGQTKISCLKVPTFYVFRVVIFAKICHPFIHLALAAISFTLLRILWPFHTLEWQFSLTL